MRLGDIPHPSLARCRGCFLVGFVFIDMRFMFRAAALPVFLLLSLLSLSRSIMADTKALAEGGMRWCVKMSFAKTEAGHCAPLYHNCVAKIFKPNKLSLQQVFSPHHFYLS